jgi:two-component system NtrC family response regulator
MPPNAKPLLIVDDDIGLLRQLRWAFADHRVYPAVARQEAIDLIKKEAIPVAVVDLGLPPDSGGASEGLATLTEILAIAPATKVIIRQATRPASMHCRRLPWALMTFIKSPLTSKPCG